MENFGTNVVTWESCPRKTGALNLLFATSILCLFCLGNERTTVSEIFKSLPIVLTPEPGIPDGGICKIERIIRSFT